MAFTDQRGYVYRCVWRDGRPRLEYLGAGRVGELIGQLDDLEQEQRRLDRLEEREQLRAAQQEQRRLDAELAPADELALLVEKATMLAAGYRQHKRQWRLARG